MKHLLFAMDDIVIIIFIDYVFSDFCSDNS